MNKVYIAILFFLILGISSTLYAFGEDPDAIWISTEVKTPSWFNSNLKSKESILSFKPLAKSPKATLSLWNNNYLYANINENIYAFITPPSNTKSITLNDNDQIYAFDGETLWATDSYKEAENAQNFLPILKNLKPIFADLSQNTFVYITQENGKYFLNFYNLLNEETKQQSLDLFNTESVSQPQTDSSESVVQSETDSLEPITRQNSNLTRVPLNLYILNDKTILIQTREKLKTSLYYSTDGSNTWHEVPVTTSSFYKQLDQLITNQNELLDLTNGTFSPASLDIPNEFLPLIPSLEASRTFKEGEYLFTYPIKPANIPPISTTLVSITETPIEPETEAALTAPNLSILNTPVPILIKWLPSAQNKILSIPEKCNPLWASTIAGLDVLACKIQDSETAQIYTRSEKTPTWTKESEIKAKIFETPKILVTSDASIILAPPCAIKKSNKEEITTRCFIAIRKNEEIQNDTNPWRVEKIINAVALLPIPEAQLIAFVYKNNALDVKLLSPTKSSILLKEFDPQEYDAVKYLDEGCIALRKTDTQKWILLSEKPGSETKSCEESKKSYLQNIEDKKRVNEISNRYGIRFSGGYFTNTKIHSWNAKLEVNFPLYSGKYEISPLFRLGASHKGALSFGYLGMVSIRWRYEYLEDFAFAIGAGAGVGNLCGELSKKDKNNFNSKDLDCRNFSMRFMISGIASYLLTKDWRVFLSLDFIGGQSWGFDPSLGIEFRF